MFTRGSFFLMVLLLTLVGCSGAPTGLLSSSSISIEGAQFQTQKTGGAAHGYNTIHKTGSIRTYVVWDSDEEYEPQSLIALFNFHPLLLEAGDVITSLKPGESALIYEFNDYVHEDLGVVDLRGEATETETATLYIDEKDSEMIEGRIEGTIHLQAYKRATDESHDLGPATVSATFKAYNGPQ